MKAAIINSWGNADVFELSDIPKPTINSGQVLIKVFASSINPVDWKHRMGNHRFVLGSPFPIVLGYDVCGEVIAVGADVKKFKVGDNVFGDLDKKYGGALAEYAVGSDVCFALKPVSISHEEAAAVPLAALTALQALRDKAKIKPGHTVIINGASGGVGLFAVQIAHIFGADVIAVASTKSYELVMQFNPYKFIDYTVADIYSLNEKADIFFDVSGTSSFLKSKQLLSPGGTYITALPRPKILFHKLLSPFYGNKKVKTLLRKHNSSDMDLLAKWLSEGKLKVTIDRIFPIQEISNAHRYAELGHTKGKNVVIF